MVRVSAAGIYASSPLAQRKPAKIWRLIGESQFRKVFLAARGRVAQEAPRSTLKGPPKKGSEYSA
jgi:hypothetical protein